VDFECTDWDGPRDRPYVTDGRVLLEATDEVLEDVAASAMLLSQGAERAAELVAEAERGMPDVAA
jgi:hypothetical protein